MSETSIDPSWGMKITLAAIRARFSSVENISTDDFYKNWIKTSNTSKELNNSTLNTHEPKDFSQNLVILDVREKEERDISYIKDSFWVDSSQNATSNVDKVKAMLMEYIETKFENSRSTLPHELNVVAYCSIGYRSSELISLIIKSKMTESLPKNVKVNYYNLDGSLFKWANEGKPLVDTSNAPTCFAHPYNSVWGKLLNEELRKSEVEVFSVT